MSNKVKYLEVTRSLSDWYMSVLHDELMALEMLRQARTPAAVCFRQRGIRTSEIISRLEKKEILRGQAAAQMKALESENIQLSEKYVPNDPAWNRVGGLENRLRDMIVKDLGVLDKDDNVLGTRAIAGAKLTKPMRQQYMEIYFGKGEKSAELLAESLHGTSVKERALIKDILVKMGKESHKRFERYNVLSKKNLRDDDINEI